MNIKKYLLSILFFIVVIFLTFYSIFSGDSIDLVISNIKLVNIKYVFICMLLIAAYFIFQGLYMKLILKSLNKKITLSKGIFYSMVEFFFSAITPSSTGGQPVQLYYMNKDKISMKKSLITLILNTIYFKLTLIILGIIIMMFKSGILLSDKYLLIFFIIGFTVDLLVIIFCYFLLYKQSVIKKILRFFYSFKNKLSKDKNADIEQTVETKLNDYKNEVNYIKSHKKEVFIGFILTLLQRMFLFSVSYVIYKSFGLNNYNYFELVFIQISVQIAIEATPLPGGTGVSEHLMNYAFINIFGANKASTAMMLTRAFSFYIPIILCLILLIIRFINDNKNKK